MLCTPMLSATIPKSVRRRRSLRTRLASSARCPVVNSHSPVDSSRVLQVNARVWLLYAGLSGWGMSVLVLLAMLLMQGTRNLSDWSGEQPTQQHCAISNGQVAGTMGAICPCGQSSKHW